MLRRRGNASYFVTAAGRVNRGRGGGAEPLITGLITHKTGAVARAGAVDPARVLAGLPHPSGANAERIAFFLGRKPRERLSGKVDADTILCAPRSKPNLRLGPDRFDQPSPLLWPVRENFSQLNL